MNKRTEQVYAYIVSFIFKNHLPPSVREIRDGCDISSNSVVTYHLRKLEDEGRIKRRRKLARGIWLIGKQ